MRVKKYFYYFKLVIFIVLIMPFFYGFKGDNKRGGSSLSKITYQQSTKTSGKVGDAFRIDVNNLNIPINSDGVIADVDIPPTGSGGKFQGHNVLFSSGFFLSGKRNGVMFANAVAPSSLVYDYIHGTVATGSTDPRAQIYVLRSTDPPFGQSWQDWKDAVALGAKFYDGDGDGKYDPVDKNGNGKWDPDEDAPDILGDVTAWCVYNDGVPAAQRIWNTVSPIGIEVRQTVFAFAAAGNIGNIVFVRYRFKYVGLNKASDPDELTDCYFGVWADPDLGENVGYAHDLVGCDTLLNAGYDYHVIPSPEFGTGTPCFLIDFFEGPSAYIPGVTFHDNNGNGIYDAGDTPIDTAHSVRGQIQGVKLYPGAENLPLSSFVEYINGDPNLNDPGTAVQARYYMLGLDRTGSPPDPCNWAYGSVDGGVNCALVDNKYWYSGNPVTDSGWVDKLQVDQRMMQNTGPFVLKKGVEKEIVVAYLVGQGANPLNSVTVAKKLDAGAQYIFDHNFKAPKAPPAVVPEVSTGENFINLSWHTSPQVSFVDSTDAWNDHFEGYNIYQYNSNNNAVTVNGQSNRILIARYTKMDFINNLYQQDAQTGGITLLYAAPDSSNQLDSNLYKNPQLGRLRLLITRDTLTQGPLIKGKPYFFSISPYAVNYNSLVYKNDPTQPVGTYGDYYMSSSAFVGLSEGIAKIIQPDPNAVGIVMSSNLYNTSNPISPANQVTGYASGNVGYDVVDPQALTNDTYEVTFTKDSNSVLYSMLWKLTNLTTGKVEIPGSNQYTYGSDSVAGVLNDGFITRVQKIDPTITPIIGSIDYSPESHIWYTNFSNGRGTGIYYVGKDLQQIRISSIDPYTGSIALLHNSIALSDAIHVGDLRRVELRFGTSGKAYRYLNGFIRSGHSTTNTYVYAAGITASDTVGKGTVGKLGQGFVDVPFTAWVVDDRFNEQKQLAVGFIEMSSKYGGKPDGIWDPTDSLYATSEVIAIFNSDYDPTGSQKIYTGGAFGNDTVWADVIRGYTIPQNAPGITDSLRNIAKSPWFNAMYVVGLERKTPTSFYLPGDRLVIPITTYPYTSNDVYKFTTLAGDQLSEADKKALFQKVNVFPNPLFGYNPATSYTNSASDDPFVTFSNLPTNVTITIYSLSGNKLRILTTADKSTPTSPFLKWNLENQSGLRVASGVYIAIVSSPKYGQKILKFSIIMPQKVLQHY